jgi:predicted DNA-binding helix-hairpin-helix protein
MLNNASNNVSNSDEPQDRDLRAITGKPIVHLDKIPLRELIRIDVTARDAVQSVMDITSCGLGEVEQLRKQGVSLTDMAMFVATAGRLPSGPQDIVRR